MLRDIGNIITLLIVIIITYILWGEISFIYKVLSENYLAFILSIFTIIILLISQKRVVYDWVHGTARWATGEEIIKEFGQPLNKKLEVGSFYLGYDDKNNMNIAIPPERALQHGLIIGGTGTGKSRGYFLPNAAWVEGTSYIITDPKSELWELTSGYKTQSIRYAPGFEESEVFNWLPLCKEADIAQLCARGIMEASSAKNADPFWLNAEISFLVGVFSHIAYSAIPTPIAAYEFFTLNSREWVLEQLGNSPSYVARQQKIILDNTDDRVKGGIIPAVANALQFLQDPKIARFTSSSVEAPDFGRLKEEPTSIYYCIHEQDIARLKGLTSIFFTVALEQLAKSKGKKGNVSVLFLLDEFANMGTLPNFATTITLARGRGVGIWMGIQALSQLEENYGKPNSETIIGTVGTRIALHGLDTKSCEYISKSLGDSTLILEKESISDGGGLLRGQSQSRTYTTQEVKRPLMTVGEVNLIGKEEAIVKVSNFLPMKLRKIFYDEPSKTRLVRKLGEVITNNTSVIEDPQLGVSGSVSALPPSLPSELLDLEKELL